MQYKSKITIRRYVFAEDDTGSDIEVPLDLHTNVFCRINWSRGSERTIPGDRKVSYRDAKIYIPRILDITVKDRVLYKEEEYEILHVSNPDEMDRYMVLEILRRK